MFQSQKAPELLHILIVGRTSETNSLLPERLQIIDYLALMKRVLPLKHVSCRRPGCLSSMMKSMCSRSGVFVLRNILMGLMIYSFVSIVFAFIY